ncbi:MAG: SH3 domain-containing protein [Aggregatilineales bacterium]
MRVLLCRFFLIAVLLAPMASTVAQGDVPSELGVALGELSRFLGRTVTLQDLTTWTFVINRYSDTALGCPYVTNPTPIPGGITAYIFSLLLDGAPYVFHVAQGGELVFLCSPGLMVPTQPPALGFDPCPPNFAGFLPPRLRVGGGARIREGGAPLRVRAQPNLGGAQIGTLGPGSVAQVIGGPSCDPNSRIIWWQVRIDEITGWTAEGVLPDVYYLAPVGIAETPLPLERSLITPLNLDALEVLALLPVPEVIDLAFSADQALLALASANGVIVYLLPELVQERSLTNTEISATAVAFSPDGRYLAYGVFPSTLVIADSDDDGFAFELPNPPSDGINALAFSPADRDVLAVGSGSLFGGAGRESISLYHVGRAALTARRSANFGVNSLAFSPDGSLLAWADSSVHLYSLALGRDIVVYPVEAPLFTPLAFLPTEAPGGGALAYADGTVVYLEPLGPAIERRSYELVEFSLVPRAIAFSPDGALLAVLSVWGPAPQQTALPRLDIFDTETTDLIFAQEFENPRAIAFSPDGTLLAVALDDEVILLGIDN